MEATTVPAAPQAYLTRKLYWKWLETHTGSEDDFLRFLTEPSVDRKTFLNSLPCELRIEEGLATATYYER